MFPNSKTGPFKLTGVGELPSGKDTATVVFGSDAPVELVANGHGGLQERRSVEHAHAWGPPSADGGPHVRAPHASGDGAGVWETVAPCCVG